MLLQRFLQVLVAAFLFLSFASFIETEEVVLSYAQGEKTPSYFYGLQPIEEGKTGWKKDAISLTERAMTFDVFFPSELTTNRSWIASVDTKEENGEKPDTFYLDLNHNQALDPGERFPLFPIPYPYDNPGDRYTVLCAEKIPFARESGEPLHVNVYYMVTHLKETPTMTEREYYALGVSSWGCLEGKATLSGTSYDVVLEDQCLNGSFGDFQQVGDWRSDMLRLSPAGKKEQSARGVNTKPLRKKIVIGGSAYAIDFSDEQQKLTFGKLDIKFGEAATSVSDTAFLLNHPDWGNEFIQAGEARALPAGSWKLAYYSRSNKDQSISCTYNDPAESTVEIKAGEKTVLDFETKLTAAVKANTEREEIRLNLVLTTAKGNKFGGYRNSDGQMIEGIPFEILNEAGDVVHEAVFKFG